MKPSKPIESPVRLDPKWTFRVMGTDTRRAVVRGKTWHEARANAAIVLLCEPGELALVEGGR